MNDLVNLPPHRELPDAKRNRARDRIVLGIWGERRGSRALLPISIAAAAVVLVGGTAGLVALHHQGRLAPAAAGTSSGVSRQSGPDVFGPDAGGTRAGGPPADQMARCAAENARQPAGRPDPAQWQPIFTTGSSGMRVAAFHTSAGPLFCELTPAMVTLSSPTSASAGPVARPTFVTAFGTVAGVVTIDGFHHLWVKTTDRTSQSGMLAWEDSGVFVAVNAVHVPAPSLTFTTVGKPGSAGRQVVVPGTRRLAVAPTRDRPLTPADQSSPAGRRLAECLANAGGGPAAGGPAVDRAAWVPGASATMADHETIQLSTYGDLFAVCTFDSRQRPDAPPSVMNTSGQPLYTAVNPYLSVAEVAFESKAADGFDVGPLLALPGVVKSAKVATVTLSGKGKPTLAATVHNGTFVMSGDDLKDYYRPNADPRGTLSVLSASGAVLATVSLH
jgi:hypothetical protein